MPTGLTVYDGSAVAYPPLGLLYAADLNSIQNRNENWYVCTGGAITASATAGKVDLAAGTNFVGTTERTYTAQAAQVGTLSATATTVAAGSNNQAINSLTSGQLVVASTVGFAASGLIAISHTGTIQTVVQYTSIVNGTTFGGCTLVTSWTNYTVLTSDPVTQVNNDLTAYKWLLCEVNATGSYAANLGSAGTVSGAVKPALTANRVLHASILLQPVSGNTSALQMDALPTTANSKSKIMESRQLVSSRADRLIYTDPGKASITNPTSLTSVCNAAGSIPASSLSVGDVLHLKIGMLVNNGTAGFKQYKVFIGAAALIDFADTNTGGSNQTGFHWVHIDLTAVVTAVGGSGNVNVVGFASESGANLHTATPTPMTTVTAAGEVWLEAKTTVTIDTTAAQTLDLQVKFNQSNGSNTAIMYGFTVTKSPVA